MGDETIAEIDFDEWLAELQQTATKDGWPTDYVEQCGRGCWRVAFDDGLSPADAWAEELAAAASSL